MSEAVVASRKPLLVELKAGRRYAWCACGRSRRQPFCDGSHAGTGFEPVAFIADADRETLLCGCKRTGRAPFCDGSHNALADTYELAGADEIAATVAIPITPRSPDRVAVSKLDGGCFVATVDDTKLPAIGGARLGPVIGASRGAGFLSQWCLSAPPGTTGTFMFPGSVAVLFLPDGAVTVTISGRDFAVGRESGVFVRDGEAFRIQNPLDRPLRILLTVCPGCEQVQCLDAMPDDFAATPQDRVQCVDPSRREPMADRFYQVLHGAETGSREVTQFIGEIPRSRAAGHHHLYEEVIVILEGEGCMWTESARAAVAPGDIIFLPRKQLHSLECTTESGMRLMGAFYPAGSPAVNY
jgi:CDGSH-type Zn-finger protein/mannose-6-phosphate isomerase-like protein (cupin superfamily)